MQGLLIFYYMGGAGGKFIANCLTYSGAVAFTDYELAVRNDPTELNQALLNTIPERDHSREWMQREHGCAQLFGPGVADIKRGAPVDSTLNDLSQLTQAWVPIIAHTPEQLHNIQTYYSATAQRLILVDAVPEFIDLAIRLKWADPSHCLDLALYEQYKQHTATLEPNYVFDAWDPRASGATDRIVAFAGTLDIALDLSPAEAYIARYQAFHGQ
jgi:hypothetical protein